MIGSTWRRSSPRSFAGRTSISSRIEGGDVVGEGTNTVAIVVVGMRVYCWVCAEIDPLVRLLFLNLQLRQLLIYTTLSLIITLAKA